MIEPELRKRPIPILTRPGISLDSFGKDSFQRMIANVRSLEPIVRGIVKRREKPRRAWGGHPAVTESLIRGLRVEHIPFSFNPMRISPESQQVLGILGGMPTLSWALAQSRSEPGFRLLVGPNVFETPLDVGRDCLNSAIVGLVTPSRWVRDFYARELPEFDRPIHVWAAGVDSNYWTPAARNETAPGKTALLYAKTKDLGAIENAKSACEAAGLSVDVVTYGKYSRNSYLNALRKASVMVVVGGTESQGLALFEAWSVGVPTLVFRHDGRIKLRYHPEREIVIEDPVNAAPYLSAETGLFWEDPTGLTQMLRARVWEKCKPREWILINATMAVAARNYADIHSSIRSD